MTEPSKHAEEWKELPTTECPKCGAVAKAFTTCEEEGFFYDGDLVKCHDCGEEGQVSCDEDFFDVYWECEE